MDGASRVGGKPNQHITFEPKQSPPILVTPKIIQPTGITVEAPSPVIHMRPAPTAGGFLQSVQHILRHYATPVAASMLGVMAFAGCATPYGVQLATPAYADTIGTPRTMAVDLDVVPMNQLAHQEKLLHGSKTIAESGCLLSSMGMVASHISGLTDLDPPKANEMIKKKRGAASGSALEVPVAAEVLGMRLTSRATVKKSNLDARTQAMSDSLQSGRPVIIGIDTKGGSSSALSSADHFLAITGLTKDGRFAGFDPAGGRRVFLQEKNGRLYRDGAPVTEVLFFEKDA